MRPEFQLTIEALQRDLAAIEQKAADMKAMINRLCEHAGVSPIYPTTQESPALSVPLSSQQKVVVPEDSRPSVRPIIRRKRSHSPNVKNSRPSVRQFVLDAMKDATEWTTSRLKDEAIKQRTAGIDESTPRNVFQGTLLALLHARQVEQTGTGTWRITSSDSHPRMGEVISIKGVA